MKCPGEKTVEAFLTAREQPRRLVGQTRGALASRPVPVTRFPS